MRDILQNTTGFIGKVFLRDSATGNGKTGVSAASMSGDYCKDDNANDIALSFATGAVTDTYSSGKWAEIGNGYYFYHYPNGCWTTLGETGFSFRASGAIDSAKKFRVIAVNPENANSGGMAYLDVAISSRNAQTPLDAAGIRSSIGLSSANLDTQLADIPTVAEFNNRTLLAASYFNPSSMKVNLNDNQGTVTIGTCTNNSDMRGTDGAAIASVWTPTRATYVDNLSAGAVATQASVDTLTNAVRNQVAVPSQYQLPASGSERFKVIVLTFDSIGNLNDPDSNTITLSVENAVGTSRSGNLYNASSAGAATTTMVRVGPGQYTLWYEIDAADAEEQLNWLASYAENAQAMLGVGSTTTVAIASGGGFNSADRTKLEAAFNKLPTALYLLGSANADGSGYAVPGSQMDLVNAPNATAIAALQSQVLSNIAGLNDISPSQVSTQVASALEVIWSPGTTAQTILNAIGSLNNLSQAEAQSATSAALAAIHLHYLFANLYDVASKPGNASALLNILMENNGGVPRYTAAALAQAPSGVSGDATQAKQDQIITKLDTIPAYGETQEWNDGDVGESETHRIVVTKV